MATTTKEQTHLATYVVPKVNLLPPEIGERKAQQRGYVAMGATVAAALAAVGFLYMGQAAQVKDAEAEVATEKKANQKLVAEQSSLSNVTAVYAEVEANEALLQLAIEKRINWSVRLHDIALQIPEGVWLKEMEVAQVANGEPTDPVKGVLPQYNLGKVTFKGRAFTHDHVASWLGSTGKIRGFSNIWYSKSVGIVPTPADRAEGARGYIEFEATADISPAALQPVRKSVTGR